MFKLIFVRWFLQRVSADTNKVSEFLSSFVLNLGGEYNTTFHAPTPSLPVFFFFNAGVLVCHKYFAAGELD